jgi:hypothetical protein
MDAQKFDDKLVEQEKASPRKELDIQFLQEMDVADGKQRGIDNLKMFEDLLSTKSMNPFGTLDKDIFLDKLNEMNKSDLQSLAMRVGVPPVRSLHDLRRSLITEFDHFIRHSSFGGNVTAQPMVSPSSPEYKTIVKLLE